MTKRTRRLLLFGPLPVVAMCGAGWLLWSHSGPRSEITRENAAMVQVGMTLAEVEAILGGPAHDDTTGPVDGDWKAEGRRVGRSINRDPDDVPDIRTWISDAVEIHVEFDHELRVIDVFSLPLRREYDGVMGMILRWLGQ